MQGLSHKCWAFSLGGCSSKLSKEHIVSAAFFEGTEITVSGFDWTGENSRLISLGSAVPKVFCKNHNSLLSELDEEIRSIRESFRKFMSTIETGNEDKPVIKIDGSKFERWLLKTTINVILCSQVKYGNFWPNYYLVELAFGKTKFDYDSGMGLYSVHPDLLGNAINVSNSINVRPLILCIEGMSTLLGSLITFYGMTFFLNTIDPLTENLGGLETKGYNLIDKRFYHPPSVSALVDGKLSSSQKLIFSYEH
jgi:hypothetical protein